MIASTSRRNPLAILLVTVFLLIPVLLSLDPLTPAVFFLLGLINLGVAGRRIRYRRFLRDTALLSTVGIGLFFLNLLFPAPGVDGLRRGSAVFLRSAALISLSVGYITLVDPYELTRALMQHLRLPPRIGFALFAGWNVIPLLQRDLRIIKKAQAIRLTGKTGGSGAFLRAAVVLLAGAVRHGERVSLSMAARGIEGGGKRSFMRTTVWTWRDTLYCVAGFVLILLTTTGIITQGWFNLNLG